MDWNGFGRTWRLVGAMLAIAVATTPVLAGDRPVLKGQKYVPGIWIDPDGCEHWVMDDGWEGYMTPNVKPDGRPVCHSGTTCASLASDQLFATDSAVIGAGARDRLRRFFTTADAKGFIITGHTDSRASDAYNLALSQRRAAAVARVAKDVGAVLYDVRGYGERMPVASNGTAAGMAKNRRVDIICVH